MGRNGVTQTCFLHDSLRFSRGFTRRNLGKMPSTSPPPPPPPPSLPSLATQIDSAVASRFTFARAEDLTYRPPRETASRRHIHPVQESSGGRQVRRQARAVQQTSSGNSSVRVPTLSRRRTRARVLDRFRPLIGFRPRPYKIARRTREEGEKEEKETRRGHEIACATTTATATAPTTTTTTIFFPVRSREHARSPTYDTRCREKRPFRKR